MSEPRRVTEPVPRGDETDRVLTAFAEDPDEQVRFRGPGRTKYERLREQDLEVAERLALEVRIAVASLAHFLRTDKATRTAPSSFCIRENPFANLLYVVAKPNQTTARSSSPEVSFALAIDDWVRVRVLSSGEPYGAWVVDTLTVTQPTVDAGLVTGSEMASEKPGALGD